MLSDITYKFVYDKFMASKKATNYEKAKEVHDYIANKSPEELAQEMGINEKDYNIAILWRYAEQDAYRVLWKFYQIGATA